MRSGFTLIEVVVALAILSLALAALYATFGASLQRSAAVRQREQAWLTAQSLLSELRRQPQLAAGNRTGVTGDGLRWSAQVGASKHAGDTQGLAAFEVTIQVRWGSTAGQQLRLQSIEVPGLQP